MKRISFAWVWMMVLGAVSAVWGMGALDGVATAQEGPAVRLQSQQPRTGDVRVERMTHTVELTVENEVVLTQIDRTHKRTEILATRGDRVSRIRVTYIEAKSLAAHAEGDKSETMHAHHGNTYFVERITNAEGDDDLRITDAHGNEPRFDEWAAVEEDNRHFDHEAGVFADLTDRDLRPGDKLPFPAALLENLRDGDDGSEVSDASLEFKGVRDVAGVRCVVFAVVLVHSVPTAGGTVAVNLSGEIIVQLETAWPVRVTLSGPMTMEGQDLTGTLRIDLSATYRRAPR